MNEKVENLIKIFTNESRKRGNYKVSIKALSKEKWRIHFERAVENYSDKKEWNPFLFIRAQFEHHGNNIWPYVLSFKSAWEVYLEYLPLFSNSKTTLSQALSFVLNDYKKIKKWSIENNYDEVNFSAYFSDALNQKKFLKGNISPYFLSICSPALDYFFSLPYEKRKSITNENTLISKRIMLFSNVKIKEKLINVFKDSLENTLKKDLFL